MTWISPEKYSFLTIMISPDIRKAMYMAMSMSFQINYVINAENSCPVSGCWEAFSSTSLQITYILPKLNKCVWVFNNLSHYLSNCPNSDIFAFTGNEVGGYILILISFTKLKYLSIQVGFLYNVAFLAVVILDQYGFSSNMVFPHAGVIFPGAGVIFPGAGVIFRVPA